MTGRRREKAKGWGGYDDGDKNVGKTGRRGWDQKKAVMWGEEGYCDGGEEDGETVMMRR